MAFHAETSGIRPYEAPGSPAGRLKVVLDRDPSSCPIGARSRPFVFDDGR
jgi:hypothetical protein